MDGYEGFWNKCKKHLRKLTKYFVLVENLVDVRVQFVCSKLLI